MLPKSAGKSIPSKLKEVSLPSKTYAIRQQDNRILGYTDNLDAIKQTVYKILSTERYEFLIYSWNYGIELKDLFGKPIPYVKSELKRRIKEALIQDDRIQDVDSFIFTVSGKSILVEFRVVTVAGVFPFEKEVSMVNV